jgi:hypothetical protein
MVARMIQKIEERLSIPRWRARVKVFVLSLSLILIFSLPIILFFMYIKYPDWRYLSVVIFVVLEVGSLLLAYRVQIKKRKNLRTKFVWFRLSWLGI